MVAVEEGAGIPVRTKYLDKKKKIEVGKSMPHLETATISKVGVHSATDNRRP